MFDNERLTGFEKPGKPQDRWSADLLKKHGLPENASLEQIEGKATELLSDIRTSLSGAELVLGRRVDGNREKEPDVVPIITQGLSGRDKFGLLLLQKEIEKEQARENE